MDKYICQYQNEGREVEIEAESSVEAYEKFLNLEGAKNDFVTVSLGRSNHEIYSDHFDSENNVPIASREPISVAADMDKGTQEPPPLPAKKKVDPPALIKRYKILTQRDGWFSGEFNPQKLERTINEYAQRGWQVNTMTTASITGLIGSNREELLVLLER